ncbi:MAG: GAF domain-containing sensor histidine kinase, partial [Halobaculum sp.]
DETSFGEDGRPAARVATDAGATEFVRLDGSPGGRAALVAAVERAVERERTADRPAATTETLDSPLGTTLLERLRRLHEATRRLMRVDTETAVARTATAAAADVLGFEVSGVRLYDSEADALVPVEMSSKTDEYVGERPAYEPGSSIHWEVLDSGECRYFDDITEIPDDVERSGSGSVMYLPLGASGVFSVGRESGGEISEQDRRLAEVLAANTTAALERAQREAALREREAALAERNDRLETFADAAAHDLRNPLNIVAANVEMAREGDAPEAHEPLADAARSVDRMERIIDRYLTLARNGQVVDTLESVTVGEVARDAWKTVETGSATLDVADEVPINADPERLRTLLENLFRNAIEHGGPDVTVTVSRLPDGTGFRVTDDGSGFGDTDPDSLFEVGATADAEGTG